MFEKFSVQDIDSAGRGGEYTVQAGFGWTNGVALWVAAQYGHQLATPACPDLLASAEAADNGASSAAGGASASASGSGSATAGAPGSASRTMSSSGTAASASPTGTNAGARTAAGGALALLVGVLAAAAIAA
jgi:alpha,alpha-trehalase